MSENGKKRDDFWDLGKPREKKYEKPDFSSHSISTTEIKTEEDNCGVNITQGEKILPRGTVSETEHDGERAAISSSFWMDPIGGARIKTSSYRKHTVSHKALGKNDVQPRKDPGTTVASYDIGNTLIKKIDIRTWETETEFYGRFTSDALLSHRSESGIDPDKEIPPVPYFSYVPQYAHMNLEQIVFYRYVRENIRRGKCVECDLPYLQLYIYEIINLPVEIEPTRGAELLARIWLGYRKMYPRLDGYLCEWLPDYCMIHGVKMPDSLVPILDEITPKAQFKEFFLDSVIEKGSDSLGKIVAEVASDYDYKSSRYYAENKEIYDRYISASLDMAIRRSLVERRGVFALDRAYKMTRDSYCGAIVASGMKRRIDIDFCSFTRRADVRATATALVKYAENKVRLISGIKARLSVELADQWLSSLIDSYFAPFIPIKSRAEDEKYMPADYLRNYEAEDTGFDADRAAEIEKRSWANTERLTGEEFSTETDDSDVTPVVDGEMSSDALNTTFVEVTKEMKTEDKDAGIRPALRAALDGLFGEYCRSVGAFPGDIADRVNTVMLDYLGDVALETNGGGYELIEDYREDIEAWLSQTQ